MWNNDLEFILSCVGYGVGLGNLWRFPYLCFQHGGLSFLIPYWICLIFCGLPLNILENCLGQFTGKSPVEVYRMFPIFSGLGWAMALMSFLCNIYYAVLIGYALMFIFHSIPKELPYVLPYSMESEFCRNFTKAQLDAVAQETVSINDTKTCQEHFFNTQILGQDSTIGDFPLTDGLTSINFPLMAAMFLAWLLIFGSLMKKTSSAGKMSYVTSILPYTCLIILLVTTLQQDGAMNGIRRYLQLDYTKMFTVKCWVDAATQIFYSQGPTWGVLLTYASKNKFNMQIIKTSCGVSILNGLTSGFACVVVYAAVGMLSYELNPANPEAMIETIGQDQGQSLAFVVYPAVLSRMGSYSWVMAIIFFLMLACLGLGTVVGMVMVIVECFSEWLDHRKQQKYISEFRLLLLVVLSHIVLGFPLITKSGNFWISVLNNYCGFLIMPTIALCEYLAIAYMYGTDKFLEEMRNMIQGPVPFKMFWKFTWMISGPFYAVFVIGMSVSEYDFKEWGGPDAGVLGNVIGLSLVSTQLGIIVWFLVSVNFKEFFASFRSWFIKVTTVKQSFYDHKNSQRLGSDSSLDSVDKQSNRSTTSGLQTDEEKKELV